MSALARRRRIALFSVHGDPLLPLGSEEAGGQNVYVREVARSLAERQVDVDVFTRGRTCTRPEVHDLGPARVIRLPAGPTGFISRNNLFRYLPEFLENVESYARWSGSRYEAVHTNYWLSGWVGLQLAERWAVPHVHTNHSLGLVKYQSELALPPHARHRIRVETQIVAGSNRTIATSPQERDILHRSYQAEGRVSIVPCGVDQRIFKPRNRKESRMALGLPRDVPLLAYAGRFDPGKGIDTLIEALAILNRQGPCHLVLAGGFDPEGPDAAEFSRIVRRVEELDLTGRTTFLGRVEPRHLATVYSAADLCVIPSHYESFGLVAIESMGCGTPVVASRVGGLQYAVQEGETGFLVPPRDPEAFARSCARVIADPVLRQRLSARGVQRVHHAFTWEAVAAQLDALYRKVHQERNVESRA
ncbi:MAG: glycosyltransferase [Candidatus Sericytochromatia bacterium]|nr:glycosyltransferase [Candidatus Sericytochromatia bacterium]